MRVPLSWLKDFVEITIPLDDLIHRMIMAGLEVANVEHIGDTWQRDKLFVGEVLEIKPHPNAERLVLAVVEYGQGTPQTVVTGRTQSAPGRARPESGFRRRGGGVARWSQRHPPEADPQAHHDSWCGIRRHGLF